MSNFGERLKLMRKQGKLTQVEMSVILGCTERHYQNYEYNKATPDFKGLIALADYFDVSIDYLVGRSDNPKRM